MSKSITYYHYWWLLLYTARTCTVKTWRKQILSQYHKYNDPCWSILITSSVNGSYTCQYGPFRSTRENTHRARNFNVFTREEASIAYVFVYMVRTSWNVLVCVRTWNGPMEVLRSCMRTLSQYELVCVRGTDQLKYQVVRTCRVRVTDLFLITQCKL